MPNDVGKDTLALLRYDARKKSVGLAYALWFFFGLWGGHWFYAGKVGRGVAKLLVGLSMFIPLVWFITVPIALIWNVVDLFILAGHIKRYNTGLVDDLASDQRTGIAEA